jgi:hypothetical protein
MSAMGQKKGTIIILILNIPRSYGSGDLRRFFTNFVETTRFECFHFKRRPLQKLENSILQPPTNEYEFLPKPLLDGTSLTNCCLVKIAEADFQEFEKHYQRQNWFDKQEVEADTLCYLKKVNSLSCDIDVPNYMEFRPPKLMPNGNVGTSTKFFLDAINSCQMPSSLISKLDLDFPKSRTRRYGHVPPPVTIEQPKNIKRISAESTKSYVPKKLVTVTGTIETNQVKLPTSFSSSQVPTQEHKSVSADEHDDFANLGEEWERHQALNNGKSRIRSCGVQRKRKGVDKKIIQYKGTLE